ncbi:MAG: hypothetical protein MUC85_13025 [Anaerolineales bacterium]|nr:hypothetical protein [Anaerolineales bacterium]
MIRQISVFVSVLATILVNALANALPINGQNTGEISDRFKVYFVPEGYVFSIWGVIYLGLIAYAVFQALPSQRDNPRLRDIGWWVVLGGLANIAWILLWHYEQFPLTIVVMLVLLATLLVTYLRLGIGKTSVPAAEKWTVRLPFSIYLGWITVATVANATSLLDYLKWDGFGLADETWMVIILGAVLTIAVLMNFTRRDAAYAAVLLWALAGIGIKHAEVSAVAIPTWITFGLVVLTFVAALFTRKLVKKGE